MDLARINNTDSWLRRFLDHNEGNQEDALAMLWSVCEWRKSFGVNGNKFNFCMIKSYFLINYVTDF